MEIQEEMVVINTSDYWTDQGYKYIGHSHYFISNREAMSYASNHKKSLQVEYDVHYLAYLVYVDNKGFYINYYTRS